MVFDGGLSGRVRHLKSHGFTEQGGVIFSPVSAHNVSFDEWRCIRFLCHEWDFGFEGVCRA